MYLSLALPDSKRKTFSTEVFRFLPSQLRIGRSSHESEHRLTSLHVTSQVQLADQASDVSVERSVTSSKCVLPCLRRTLSGKWPVST